MKAWRTLIGYWKGCQKMCEWESGEGRIRRVKSGKKVAVSATIKAPRLFMPNVFAGDECHRVFCNQTLKWSG